MSAFQARVAPGMRLLAVDGSRADSYEQAMKYHPGHTTNTACIMHSESMGTIVAPD